MTSAACCRTVTGQPGSTFLRSQAVHAERPYPVLPAAGLFQASLAVHYSAEAKPCILEALRRGEAQHKCPAQLPGTTTLLRNRSDPDLPAAGLFLASLAVHYSAEAKRYMPEALALYCRIMAAAAPRAAAGLAGSEPAQSGKKRKKRAPDAQKLPEAAGQLTGQLEHSFMHPLDSLDWRPLSRGPGADVSMQPMGLVSLLAGPEDMDSPDFRWAHACCVLGIRHTRDSGLALTLPIKPKIQKFDL